MLWDSKNMDLEFNCACGTKVEKRNTFRVEYLLSGNCAYECPDCHIVYDVWTKRNQNIFMGLILIALIGAFIIGFTL